MRLSEAILSGSTLCKAKAAPTSTRSDEGNGCALTMGALAVGAKVDVAGMNAWHAARTVWPWLDSAPPSKMPCPVGCGIKFNDPHDRDSPEAWEWAIAHIFDLHIAPLEPGIYMPFRWTLEQLVDYVRSIEPEDPAGGAHAEPSAVQVEVRQ